MILLVVVVLFDECELFEILMCDIVVWVLLGKVSFYYYFKMKEEVFILFYFVELDVWLFDVLV